MIRRPPRSTLTHSFPTRRSSDLGAIGAFREAVLQQASTSLTKERGGRCFDVSFDTACPERMFPYEIYDDGETFDRHRETGHFADFDRQTSKSAKRSEEHTSELQSLMRISYAVFCLKKKIKQHTIKIHTHTYTTSTQC